MLKKIKQYMTVAAFGLMLALPLGFGAVASAANIQGNLCQGSDLTAPADPVSGNTNCEKEAAGTGVDDIVATVINIFSWVVGVVSVIMIIVGGFQYVTSGGDSNKVGTAKNTILYAIVGLVIVAFAQIIVQFVLDKVVS